MDSVNIAALVLRLAVGGTMIAHGWNHAFGGGKLPGTARWFESIGIRPGRLHALFATVTELGAGAFLCSGCSPRWPRRPWSGRWSWRWSPTTLKNGFFIFRPGEGYEYVLMIIARVRRARRARRGRLVGRPCGRLRRARVGGTRHHGARRRGGAALLLATSWRPRPAASPGSRGPPRPSRRRFQRRPRKVRRRSSTHSRGISHGMKCPPWSCAVTLTWRYQAARSLSRKFCTRCSLVVTPGGFS